MCGLTGIFHFDGSPVDLALVMRMNRTLHHRGPDEEGYFINQKDVQFHDGNMDPRILAQNDHRIPKQQGRGNVGLGHRRLSIIDLATGQQPLCNEDGTIWTVFNGEIYNFLELKSQLEAKGHIFRTSSDTETIVHAYEQWGESAIKKFRGMFAIALWDENKQQLLLARDRVGKKPLYYHMDRDRFVFASEIKAILKLPSLDRELDLMALSDYLSLTYIPSPKSIFKSIRKLPAAHYATVRKGKIEIKQYWDIQFFPNQDLSDKQILDDMLGILGEATSIRMISEVPLGAFLSGGVDSSAVVAMMANESRNPVVTNSISFLEDRYNEAVYARQVARLFQADHNEFQVTPEAIPIIEKLSWHYDEPFADSSAVPTYYVSKTARQNVTVSLSGDGGDESFAGYSRYYFDQREHLVRNLLPRALQGSVFGFIRDLYPASDTLSSLFRGKAFMANVSRDPVDAYFFTVSAIHDAKKKEIFNSDVARAINGYETLDLFKKYYKNAPADDHLSKIQYLDIKTYLCDDILTKVDRASMAVSLEVRSPLLDHEFMEYAARIPKSKKLVGSNGKHIFKKALEKYLPKEVLYREKMGFALPVAEWLRKDIKSYGRKLIIDGGATEKYLNRPYIQSIWDAHQKKAMDLSPTLWMIMMLNLWHKRFVE